MKVDNTRKMAYAAPKDKHYCKYCGWVDCDYDENAPAVHEVTTKHNCNRMLYEYKTYKADFSKNRDGISIYARGIAVETKNNEEKTCGSKVILHVKPQEVAKFYFYVKNELKKEDMLILGIQLAHPQQQFVMNKHSYVFTEEPRFLASKASIEDEISVTFKASDIGQYEMPIMFTFHSRSANRDIIFIREMVVLVDEFPVKHPYTKNPYTDEPLMRAENFLPAVDANRRRNSHDDVHNEQTVLSLRRDEHTFRIPKMLKVILPKGLGDDALDSLPRNLSEEVRNQFAELVTITRSLFDEGLTINNYMNYFHHLLWWEEIIAKVNIRKYNMHAVTLKQRDKAFLLEVPGLAEKRPSLIRGDKLCLQPHENLKDIFECVIKNIEDNYILLWNMDGRFHKYYNPEALFDVRFIMSRIPLERCHHAVNSVFSSQQQCRVFPEPNAAVIPVRPIAKFYNPHIKRNKQQKSAVEHIVAGSSGLAPYIVFGPPGTGKTMTIVEAIIQLVVRNAKNRILVCTDSNMAADHIALTLLKYNSTLQIQNFLLRANSQMREWTVMPRELIEVSNGSSYETFVPLTNIQVSNHRVVVTTLLHSAKYAHPTNPRVKKLRISHLFIDEAAQASEPAALIPIAGLLVGTGQLVLAGDPQQLGPVCNAREAGRRGLGTSLLERLYTCYPELYDDNPQYITTLINNFRSHPDILNIPNQLFYKGELKALAPLDALSNINVLEEEGGDRAIVFHAVNSHEQRMGHAPSFFNEKELEMIKRYVKTLIEVHAVVPRDIGIIAPYIRQVYKMKAWLKDMRYDTIDVGTVEAFQGKEKRVILVSTVRANCRLLDYDARYSLGFLVDDKRFNVAITRAKAKLIIIGNASCLTRDIKWRIYMAQCKKMGTYLGENNQQMERNSVLLQEIAKTRFDKCRLTDALRDNIQKRKDKKKNKKDAVDL
ncbi:hypothetical protein O3G_MSEX000020 [Manduca sexta]|nr:hypothetical protein O3G_MSEX000020 [Manduca sexta]